MTEPAGNAPVTTRTRTERPSTAAPSPAGSSTADTRHDHAIWSADGQGNTKPATIDERGTVARLPALILERGGDEQPTVGAPVDTQIGS